MSCACTDCTDLLPHIYALHSQVNMVFSLHLLVFGFRCHFERCVKTAKILEEETNRAEERKDTSISTSGGKTQGARLFARKWCKQALSGRYQRFHEQT